MRYFILYNPLSDNSHGIEGAKAAKAKLADEDVIILVCGGMMPAPMQDRKDPEA